jgi:hypothetical protein
MRVSAEPSILHTTHPSFPVSVGSNQQSMPAHPCVPACLPAVPRKPGVRGARGSTVITAKDICTGHKEKTLALLWSVMFHWHIPSMVDAPRLGRETTLLRRCYAKVEAALAALEGTLPPTPKDADEVCGVRLGMRLPNQPPTLPPPPHTHNQIHTNAVWLSACLRTALPPKPSLFCHLLPPTPPPNTGLGLHHRVAKVVPGGVRQVRCARAGLQHVLR